MNEIGAYDGLDMTGIDPAWYENYVTREQQDRVVAYDSKLRVIWTPKAHGYRVVHKQPRYRQTWGAGTLVGWAPCFLMDPPEDRRLDVDALLCALRRNDRWKNYGSHRKADEAFNKAADDAHKIRKQKVEAEATEPFEAIVDEAMASHTSRGWFNRTAEKQTQEELDSVSGRRDLKKGPVLFVPARVAAEIREKRATAKAGTV